MSGRMAAGTTGARGCGVPDSIVALLREAGWQAPPDDGRRDPAGERLLASLAGLSLGKTGAGRETAASDVAFYERPCEPDEDESLEGLPWRGRTGPLRAVADAHHHDRAAGCRRRGLCLYGAGRQAL